MILETCRFLEKRNQSGTSKKSSRKVKRSQEPVKTPPRSHDEFHTQYIFFFSFFSYEAKLHMPVLAAGPWEFFLNGVLISKKKKKKKKPAPPSRGTARVLLVSCQPKKKRRIKITAFSSQFCFFVFLGGHQTSRGCYSTPAPPTPRGLASSSSINQSW